MGETETFMKMFLMICLSFQNQGFQGFFSEQCEKSSRKMIRFAIIFWVIVFVAAPGGSVGYIHEITIYDFITKT